MRVTMLTKEFPPDNYGGAGVHVEYLAREVRKLVDLRVHAWGKPRSEEWVDADEPWDRVADDAALQALSLDLVQALDAQGADLVHSHTWYCQFGGHLAKLLHGIPHVATVHSLEPLRPWKAEQLGGGYRVSSWVEKTSLEQADAVVAVSGAVRADILRCYPDVAPERVHVIPNGVDLDDYRPEPDPALLRSLGVDPDRPTVLFVGRITRQKGIGHLLAAAHHLPPTAQVVVRAGAADTPEIAAETAAAIDLANAQGHEVVWIDRNLERSDLSALLASCTVFCCPSVYEPFGLVNVEAMACSTPVVASAVGGIVEVVTEGTGLLVPFEPGDDGTGEPADPAQFAADLGAALTRVIEDPPLAASLGEAGRQRVADHYAWDAVARRTVDLYDSLTP